MRLPLLALAAALILPAAAMSADSPSPQRKAGWWEITSVMFVGTPIAQVIHLCTDAATEAKTNVFVNRQSYRSFLASGRWPDKTMFLLEIRQAEKHVSINNGGETQGAIVALEAAVKDSERFPGTTWGYFSFDGPDGLRDTAAPLPTTASCYTCHQNNTAVENTFVQFYPTLMDVARRMGTVKPTYDPLRKP